MNLHLSHGRFYRIFIAASTVCLMLAAIFVPMPAHAHVPQAHTLHITARTFAFDPVPIAIRRGDTVTIELEALDAVHGLYVDGYDVNLVAEPGKRASTTFVADKEGKFKFRCSVACGALHPFMIGELNVEPNIPLVRALLITLTGVIGALAFFGNDPDKIGTHAVSLNKTSRHEPVGALVIDGIHLALFLLAILTGLFGTPAGSRNFGIIFVWIVWWALLILLMVPFVGRLWCAVCPIPAPGEWLQRRALIQPRPGGKLFTLGLKFPRRLKNIWMQNATFLAVALFSVVILTTPFVSALVLLFMIVLAMATSMLFERRVFCRYICPVGGFIGLYSQVAPIEVRVKDTAVCKTHVEKTCYQGSDDGYGFPWLVYPAALDKNTYCGMCMECMKTCPHDNMGIFLRVPGKDLQSTQGRRLDEAYKAFIMLTCALAYSIVLLGPWSLFKESAYAVGTSAWWLYAGIFLAANLVIVPGIFFACTALARKLSYGKFSLRRTFVEYAYVLVPLGLAAWAAFTISFVFVNFSYAWQVVSDPFGWGWNLFGTADWTWTPYLAGLQSLLQIPILLVGLIAAIGMALRTARSQSVPRRAALPVVAFCAAFTLGLLWLYV